MNDLYCKIESLDREIKFRIWDKRKKEIEYCTFEYAGCIYDEYGHEDNEYYKIMQYTGVKDKNGEEIYEGDLLTKRTSDIQYGVVIYNKLKARYEIVFDDGMTIKLARDKRFMWDVREREVVGNIYEGLKDEH